jgi:hypothetical protein
MIQLIFLGLCMEIGTRYPYVRNQWQLDRMFYCGLVLEDTGGSNQGAVNHFARVGECNLASRVLMLWIYVLLFTVNTTADASPRDLRDSILKTSKNG